MNKEQKIIGAITALSLAAAGAIGADKACLFDAEIVKAREEVICFSKENDYKKYKLDHIQDLKKEGNLYLWTAGGQELLDVIQHEFEKKGIPELKDVKGSDDIFNKMIQYIQ